MGLGAHTLGARSVLVVLATVADAIEFHFAPTKTDKKGWNQNQTAQASEYSPHWGRKGHRAVAS